MRMDDSVSKADSYRWYAEDLRTIGQRVRRQPVRSVLLRRAEELDRLAAEADAGRKEQATETGHA
jgi:hypothetical protein